MMITSTIEWNTVDGATDYLMRWGYQKGTNEFQQQDVIKTDFPTASVQAPAGATVTVIIAARRNSEAGIGSMITFISDAACRLPRPEQVRVVKTHADNGNIDDLYLVMAQHPFITPNTLVKIVGTELLASETVLVGTYGDEQKVLLGHKDMIRYGVHICNTDGISLPYNFDDLYKMFGVDQK